MLAQLSPLRSDASQIGQCGVQLEPLAQALKQIVLQQHVIHADETPVTVMQIGEKKPKKGYVWAYATTQYNSVQAVVYDFQPELRLKQRKTGQHPQDFLKGWQGQLVCDDYSGYKAQFKNNAIKRNSRLYSRTTTTAKATGQ